MQSNMQICNQICNFQRGRKGICNHNIILWSARCSRNQKKTTWTFYLSSRKNSRKVSRKTRVSLFLHGDNNSFPGHNAGKKVKNHKYKTDKSLVIERRKRWDFEISSQSVLYCTIMTILDISHTLESCCQKSGDKISCHKNIKSSFEKPCR